MKLFEVITNNKIQEGYSKAWEQLQYSKSTVTSYSFNLDFGITNNLWLENLRNLTGWCSMKSLEKTLLENWTVQRVPSDLFKSRGCCCATLCKEVWGFRNRLA